MRNILFFAALIAAAFIATPASAGIYGPTTTCPSGFMNYAADSLPGGGPGTWTISDTTVAKFYGWPPYTGRSVQVQAVSAGVATLTYTQTTGYATLTVTVSTAPVPVTYTGSTTIPLGSSVEIHAHGVNDGCFTSSSSSVTAIDCNTGLDEVYASITGAAVGTAVISYATGCPASPSGVTVTVVPAVDCISGTVSGGVSYYYGKVKVWLIKYDSSSHMLAAVDSNLIETSSGGHYQFCGVGTDSFRVKAEEYVPSELYDYYHFPAPTNCPTYHVSSSYWNTATVFYHTAGTNDTGKNITLIAGTMPGGPGFIAGDVTTGANKGTSGSAGAPYMLVYCLDNSTGAVVQHTYTDHLGHYSFSNLAVGQTYKIYPEELSYATTPYANISLTTAAPSKSGASFVEHTVSHTITPVLTAVPGIDPAGIVVNVFPNPSNGKVNVQWTGFTGEKADVFITDITGRRVLTATIDKPQVNGHDVIDISSLKTGLYYLTLKAGDFNYNTKLERL